MEAELKREWDPVKLRVAFGDVFPEPGDVLAFQSGRRYQVLRTRGKTLHCIVLPASERIARGVRVLPWCWAPRKRRPR